IFRVVAAGEQQVAALGDCFLPDQAPVHLDVRDRLRLLHGGDLVPVLRRGVGPARHQGDRHRFLDDGHAVGVDVLVGVLDLLGGLRAAAVASAGGQSRSGGEDGGGGENGAAGEGWGGDDVLSEVWEWGGGAWAGGGWEGRGGGGGRAGG